MSIVAGVDFGTLSVRVAIFDKERGKLGMAVAEYPLHRSPSDPNLATQSHDDQMAALTRAMRVAVKASGIDGKEIRSLALDTTGSSVVMVGEGLQPLGEYYLWADHRASSEAAEITAAAHRFPSRSHRLVRRRLLLRVGLFETPSLAPSQSRKARPEWPPPSNIAT